MLRRRFIPRFLLILILGLSVQSCAIKKNLEDITDNANQILEQLARLSRNVNSSVETGKLTDELGGVIDDRIENLATIIEDLLINGGGFLFDEVNGTLNNTFDNVGSLIEDLNEDILEGSIPANIQLVSNELMLHTNNISAHATDLINLTFGNTSILISQATNSLLTMIAWIILGVGLLLIILMLIILGSRMNKATRILVTVLISIFMLIPIGFLFIPPVKALVLKSMNVGEEIVARSLVPKLIGITPTEYEIGTDDALMAFGVHLDQLSLDSIEIGLYQSGTRKVAFSKQSIKVMTANKIVISDFGKSQLNWERFTYRDFSSTYSKAIKKSLPTNYKALSTKANIVKIKRKLDIKPQAISSVNLAPLVIAPVSAQGSTNAAVNSPSFTKNVAKIMKARYTISEGDYELRVYKKGSDQPLSGVQHIKISYPPPPPPKPDVFPISVSWVNGNPTKGENARLQVKLGVIYGEEADKSIAIGLSSNPAISGLNNIEVTRTKLRNANSNFLLLTSSAFKVKSAGVFSVRANADVASRLAESNESNNQASTDLRVKDYKYNVTISFSTFTSHEEMDGAFAGEDEYRIDINTTVPGHGEWHIDYNKNGEPHNNYNINQSQTFTGISEGALINIHTTGREADSGATGGDDGMGSMSDSYRVGLNSSGSAPIQLSAGKYTIRGEIRYTKVVVN